MKKTVGKVLNIVVTVLIVLVLIASAFVLVVTFTAKDENGGVPNLLGKSPVSVLSNSMQGDGELNFNKGDLLICDAVSVEDRVEAQYKVGDVVCFPYDIDGDGYNDYVTHRIYKINKDGTYLTKGDNNDTYDQDPNGTTKFSNVIGSDIVAVYHGAKIPGVGDFINYIRTQQGFFLIVLLPMIIFFLYEAVRVVINVMAYSKEKGLIEAQKAIENADLTEEQKAKAIAEYLAAQNGEAEQDNPKDDEDESEEEGASEALEPENN